MYTTVDNRCDRLINDGVTYLSPTVVGRYRRQRKRQVAIDFLAYLGYRELCLTVSCVSLKLPTVNVPE